MADERRAAPTDSIPRNTLFALAGQLSLAVFTIIVTLFLLRALEPEGFGEFALALSIAGLARFVASFGIPASAARFVAEERADLAACAAILRDSLRLTLITSSAAATGLVIASVPLANAFNEPSLVWPLRGMACLLIGESVLLLYLGTFAALARVKLSFPVLLLEGAVETTATVALVLAGAGVTGAAFGRAVGYACGAVAALALVVTIYGRTSVAVRRHPASGRSRQIARYAVPSFFLDLMFGLYARVDVFIISSVLTATATGLFSAPMRLVTGLSQLGGATATGVAPMQAATGRTRRRVDAFVASLRWLLIFETVCVAPLLVWADPITNLLFGSDYSESANVLRLLVPYFVLSSLGPLVGMTVNYLGKAARRIPITAAALGLNIVIDVTLLPVIGVTAAAIGTSAAYGVYVPAHLLVCQRELNFSVAQIAITLARSLLAAAAMSAVLYVIGGTESLTVTEALLGTVGGVAAYVLVLFATREVTRSDLAELRRLLAALRS